VVPKGKCLTSNKSLKLTPQWSLLAHATTNCLPRARATFLMKEKNERKMKEKNERKSYARHEGAMIIL
jgi:hypothetical protein